MASEIRVDKINSLSGVGTVTLSPTGVDISGITTVSTLKVGTGVTASEDGDIFFTGIATATTFSGSGASLTALPAAQLSGTLPAISGANLTALNGSNIASGTVADARISTLTASKLSGALPAISALNLTNVPAANVVGVHTSLNITGSTTTGTAVVGGGVTISESGIEASGIGITCANINGSQLSGRRNLIINGAMKVAQRGTVDQLLYNYAGPDRFYLAGDGNQRSTISQASITVDSKGQSNAYKLDVATANASPSAGHYQLISYRFEGQDLQHLEKGTSNAKPVTLQFWVRSPKTGVHIVELVDQSNSARHINKSYTISSANTWQKVEITFEGDTTGAITNDNGRRLDLNFWLMAGSTYSSGTLQTSWGSDTDANRAVGQVNVVDSTSNDFYLTGVQLEVGSQATAFEHRTVGDELALCQRYYFKYLEGNQKEIGVAWYYLNTHASFFFEFPTTMRAVPTGTDTTGTNYYTIYRVGGPDAMDSITFENVSTEQCSAYNNGGASGTAGQAGLIRSTNASAKIEFSAEL